MNHPAHNELDEREVGLFVRHQLNAGIQQLEPRVSKRLFAARQKALKRHSQPVAALSLAGFGQISRSGSINWLRPVMLAGVLVMALTAGNHLMSVQHIENQEEIDAALLSDNLPISAYLDTGFQSWLADSSRP